MKGKWLFTSLLLMISTVEALARDIAQTVEMADRFRADGKIYVVVAVILVLILGLSLLIFRMDRKISRLEKRMEDKAD